jgi:flavin-dependent dehydrogenase
MARIATRRTADRLVLIGDAVGFVDSIAGDGRSIALNPALILGVHLPDVLARGATRKSLAAYERAARRLFRSYWAKRNPLRVTTSAERADPPLCRRVSDKAARRF